MGGWGRLLPSAHGFISAPGGGPRWLTTGQEQGEARRAGERADRVTRVESVIYFFIIKIREGTGAEDGEVNLMTQA